MSQENVEDRRAGEAYSGSDDIEALAVEALRPGCRDCFGPTSARRQTELLPSAREAVAAGARP